MTSSFGEELKRERELRQISLREISEATKINLRYLDALERNDFRHLPGGVFNKGFVRAYAQYIGVDPEAMVNAYLLEERDQRENRVEGRSPEVFRSPSGAVRGRPGHEIGGHGRAERRGPRIAAWVGGAAGLVIVLAAAAGWWWITSHGPARVSTRPADEPTAQVHPAPGDASSTPASGPATDMGVETIRLVLRRPTSGSVNCDNRRLEVLDDVPSGTELTFHCGRFLRIDARDGGALLFARGDATLEPLGSDGLPVQGHVVRVAPDRSPDEDPS